MFNHARHLFGSAMSTLIAILLVSAPLRAQDVSVVSAAWIGNDYVIRFSDSLRYTVDLGASDSMLVLSFSRPVAAREGAVIGPNGISATLSRNAGDSMAVLTVRGDQRIGYSTLWRPYSRRLIVHTFNWDSLEYGAEQYHKGLLALEQGLTDQARGYLSSALAFDNGEIARRASSILGILYTLEGKDSLARIYLTAPFDPDDYMARAELNRRTGDLDAALRDEEMFREKMDRAGDFAEAPREAGQDEDEAESRPPIAKIFDDWRGVLLVAIAACLIIALAVWFSRRPVSPRGTSAHESHGHDHQAMRESTPDARSQGGQTTWTSAPVPPSTPATVSVVRESREERPETAPDPIISSLHAPEIVTSSSSMPIAVEREGRTSGPIELPHPDALPDRATENEVYATRVQVDAESKEGEPMESRRGSAQADQLRRRMEAAISEKGQAQSAKPVTPPRSTEQESTVHEARRLNVSRDYVELRNRIAELRRRIQQG